MIENAFKGAVIGAGAAVVVPLGLMLHSATFNHGGSNLGIGVFALAMPFILPGAAVVGWFIGKRWPQK